MNTDKNLSPISALGGVTPSYPNNITAENQNEKNKKLTPEEEIELLAKLSVIEYEFCRGDEAKRLGIRSAVLDKEVESRRVRKETENNDYDELTDGIEPCGYFVQGEYIAKIIIDSLNRHLILPNGADVAITLWIMASYTIDSFRIFPKLCLSSPEKRCGKTTTLEVIQSFSNRGLPASNVSASVIFRVINRWKPTLLIDEADTFINSNEELRGIINSGHTKSQAYVLRNDRIGDEFIPNKYSTWSPMVIAMIKKPPSTIIDRSVMIELQRKKLAEKTERLPRDHIDLNEKYRAELMQWASDNHSLLKKLRPAVPELNNDRAMDNWEPLFAVAEVIGWNEAAKESFIALNVESENEKAIETKLLEDIKEAFGNKERLFSSELVKILVSDEDNIWCEWRHGQPMTANSLSRLLKPYKVKPKTIRINIERKKGYELKQFEEVFGRYLDKATQSKRDNVTSSTGGALSEIQSVTNDKSVTVKKSSAPPIYMDCHDVTDGKGVVNL